MRNYIAIVRLAAYDSLAVTADSPETAREEVHRILRDEQKYQQRQFRPLLASIDYIREDNEGSEIVWSRGEDPLERLLVSGSG